jgi:hypothetical protein
LDWEKVDQLAEDGPSVVQRRGSLGSEIPKDARTPNRNSNRLRTLLRLAFCLVSSYDGTTTP